MNIYLIHGDNSLVSYQRLQEYQEKAKSKNWDVTIVENPDINITDIFRSNNLFESNRLVIIKKYPLVTDLALEYLNKSNENLEIVIYHDKQIPITFIKKLKNVKKNEEFKLSKFLWKFIESFYPGNVKNCLFYFHQTLISEPVELIFSILVGQIKDIYLFLDNNNNLQYQPWRLNNLKKQSEKYTMKKITDMINEMSEIDIKVKTSTSNLKDELDFLIIRKLE